MFSTLAKPNDMTLIFTLSAFISSLEPEENRAPVVTTSSTIRICLFLITSQVFQYKWFYISLRPQRSLCVWLSENDSRLTILLLIGICVISLMPLAIIRLWLYPLAFFFYYGQGNRYDDVNVFKESASHYLSAPASVPWRCLFQDSCHIWVRRGYYDLQWPS